MVKHAMLNNIDHKGLKVATGRGADLGDDVMCVLALPSEFRNIVADYPIFFQRNTAADSYSPVAMFGFQNGENLFLTGDQWNATYIPLMIRRGPFSIGFQESGEESGAGKKMVIAMDMDNPRVGVDQGELLFEPFGGNTRYTDQVVEVLPTVARNTACRAFILFTKRNWQRWMERFWQISAAGVSCKRVTWL
jgi:hypothetical protein